MSNDQLSPHKGANYRLEAPVVSWCGGVLRADDFDDLYYTPDQLLLPLPENQKKLCIQLINLDHGSQVVSKIVESTVLMKKT